MRVTGCGRNPGQQPLAILAPAFPAAGRTMVGGLGLLNGVALKETETWRHAGLTRPTEPAAWLATEGLRVTLAGIDEVRLGPYRLAASFAERSAAGADAVLCDAQIRGGSRSNRGRGPRAGAKAAVRRIGWTDASLGRSGRASACIPGSAPAGHGGRPRAHRRGQRFGGIARAGSSPRRREGGVCDHGHALSASWGNGVGPDTCLCRTDRRSLVSGTDLAISVTGSEGVDLREGRQVSAFWPTLLRRGCTASVASLPPAARPPGLSSPAPAHQA